ncbi:MAG: hypothetical protein CVV27_04990 [Candidatus Melainabacteria bacterium HGW-Melainabacteria-1]|nr:MAG: hypothetical protein CVV27_04990 [Candidatus Melainabacteria bacterium HGW-Melainabacteria-1]
MRKRPWILLAIVLWAPALQAATPKPVTPKPATSQTTPKPASTPAKSASPSAVPSASPACPCARVAPVNLPAEPERLILVPFENRLKDQDNAIGDTALDTLQMRLLKPENRYYRLIGRKHVKAILAELAFSESALSDPKNALKLGQLLSAKLMLTGMVSAGKIHTSEVTNLQPIEYTWATVQVSATLLNIETGEVLFASKALGSSQRFPTWQGDTYTSIILEAVEAASATLSDELIANRQMLALPATSDRRH